MTCERCSAESKGFELFDYCTNCGKNLCDKCLKEGCCGKSPAESGQKEDHSDEEET